MWYVIRKRWRKSSLALWSEPANHSDQYAAMIADNTICDALSDYAVQPGDVFFLPAGRIHSIGAGCFIAEIQQTSNITYRIYDFNRKDKNGIPANCIPNCQKMQSIILYRKITVHITLLSRTNR